MQQGRGGRLVLRLVATSVSAAEYAGALEFDDATAQITMCVRLPSGAVEVISSSEPSPPEWLVDQARAALRAAFRATLSGAPWPRKLSRWREVRDTPEQGEGKS